MIGIYGGTFDPVHFGHLKTAADVKNQLQLEQVRLIPLGVAVHREQPQVTGEQRLAMLEMALSDETGLVTDNRELQRDGGSFMVDTLSSLKQDFPDQTLVLILGTDAFEYFTDWKQPETILQLAHLVVMQRPGSTLSQSVKEHELLHGRFIDSAQDLKQQDHGLILPLDVVQVDVSSTSIREKISQQQPITADLPQKVANFIQQHKLYR